MSISENYDLKFVNTVSFNRVKKEVHGKNIPGILYSPLSEYLYIAGHYEAIADILVDVNAALSGHPFNDGIEVGTERISFNVSAITIENSDGRVQSLPTIDFKAILEEYQQFLNTPPLNGTYVK